MSKTLSYSLHRVGLRLRGNWGSYGILMIEIAISILILCIFLGVSRQMEQTFHNLQKDAITGYFCFKYSATSDSTGTGRSDLEEGGRSITFVDYQNIQSNFISDTDANFFMYQSYDVIYSESDSHFFDQIAVFFVDSQFYRFLVPNRIPGVSSDSVFIGSEVIPLLEKSGIRHLSKSVLFSRDDDSVSFFEEKVQYHPMSDLTGESKIRFPFAGEIREYDLDKCIFYPLEKAVPHMQWNDYASEQLNNVLMLVPHEGASQAKDVAKVLGYLDMVHGDSFLYEARSILDGYKTQLEGIRKMSALAISFGLLSIVVIIIGLSSVFLVIIRKRMMELSISLLLGATKGVLVGEILVEIFSVTFIGVAAGIGLYVLLLGTLGNAIGESMGLDALIVLMVLGVAAVIGIVSAWLPLRRLTEINPISVFHNL